MILKIITEKKNSTLFCDIISVFISVCHQPATQGQLSLPSLQGLEYQLRLGRQRHVCFIPLEDERGVCR